MDVANDSAVVGAGSAEPASRMHRLAYHADMLWIFGLATAVFCSVGSYLPCHGEALEWGVYMALGVFVPLGVLCIGTLHLIPRLRDISAVLRLVFAFIGVLSTGLLWMCSIPSTAVIAPFLGGITGALYLLCVPVSGEPRFRARLALATVILLVSTSAWIAAPRLLYWTSLNKWVHESNSWYSPTVTVLVTLLTTIGLFAWDQRACSSAPLGRIARWGGHVAAITLFLWMGSRTDSLFGLTSVHHWGFWIGPAQSVRDGGWLLWDVPSQYGLLSILTLAFWPMRDVWQSLFCLQMLLSSVVAFMIYALLRQWSRGVLNYLFSVLTAAAAVYFLSGVVQDLSGPGPWLSVGAMRFLWCHASLMALWYCLARAKASPSRYLWLGGGLWLIGVFWSVESAIYATSVFGAGSAVLFLQELVPAFLRQRPWKRAVAAASPFLFVPIIAFACAVALIEGYYRTRLGHGPDWHAYWEYAASYSNGFGALPVSLLDSLWVLLGVFCAVSAAICWMYRTDPLNPRLAVCAGAWGAVWSTASYYVSRSHPNNVNNLAPIYLMVLAILLPLVRTAPKPLRLALYHIAFPLFLVSILAPCAHPALPALLARPQPCRTHVSATLPAMEPSAVQLLRDTASLDQPFACNYAYALLPLPIKTNPITGECVSFEHSWLPQPLVMLVVLPIERQCVYIERHIQREHKDGWLLMYLPPDTSDILLRYQISLHYRMVEVKRSETWGLYWCHYRTPDERGDGSPSHDR